jgi:hypothetical protein
MKRKKAAGYCLNCGKLEGRIIDNDIAQGEVWNKYECRGCEETWWLKGDFENGLSKLWELGEESTL